MDGPDSLALYEDRYLFVAELLSRRVSRIDLKNGTIEHFAGNGGDCCFAEGAPATDASFDLVLSIALNARGDLFLAGPDGIARIDSRTGRAYRVPIEDSSIDAQGIAFDSRGNLFVAAVTQIVRFNAAKGPAIIIAGTGKEEFGGDGGPAVDASLYESDTLALDSFGNIFVADVSSCRLLRIDGRTGILKTVFIADVDCREKEVPNGFTFPTTVENPVIGPDGAVYFAVDNQVGRLNPNANDPVVIAGNGEMGYSGDGGPATSAEFNGPSGMAFDSQGNLYISDSGNNRIRRVDAKTRIITTIAGNGEGRHASYE